MTKVIDTLTQEDFDGAFRSCSNGTTSALQPEEITLKGTTYVCTIYKSAHTKKSENLFNDPRILSKWNAITLHQNKSE